METNQIDQMIRELLPPNSMGNFFSCVLLEVELAVKLFREFLPPSAAEQINQLNLAGKRLREVFRECLACANYPHALASVISILHLYGEYPERAEPKGWAEEGEKTLNRREMPAKSENRQTIGV